jgi:hypothetical protein
MTSAEDLARTDSEVAALQKLRGNALWAHSGFTFIREDQVGWHVVGIRDFPGARVRLPEGTPTS